MKSSIVVVVVRSFVAVRIMINWGCPADSLSISSCKIALACSILGHLKNVKSCVGWKSFLLSINFPFESHRKTALLFTDAWIGAGAMSCGVGGVIFSVIVSGSVSCCVLDKLSDVPQFWSSENLFSVGIFTVSFWAVMGCRDASQSVILGSLSVVFSEQEDLGCVFLQAKITLQSRHLGTHLQHCGIGSLRTWSIRHYLGSSNSKCAKFRLNKYNIIIQVIGS